MKAQQKSKTAIDAEVQKTLQSLDQIKKVKASPFFYTRLQQRLANRRNNESASIPNAIWGKVLRPALVPLLIVASVGAGILLGYKPKTENRTAYLNNLIETYGLNAPDLSNYTLTAAE